jgi:glutathione synthase/RimK-type ligase-like ATP-grasp enzyme
MIVRGACELDKHKTRMNNLKSKSPAVSTIKVLLTDTNRWALAARLAISLSDAGCEVSAVCPERGHALLKTRAVERTFRYSGFRPIESLAAAIEAVEPDIIIPSCDRGVEHLHELYARTKSCGTSRSKLVALIERSLGSPASHSTVSSRYELLKLAGDEGVRVPNTSRVDNPEELESWGEGESFPWVLKADGTWGGGGVKIIQTPDQVHQSFAQLTRMFQLGRAVKRLIVNRDSFWLRPWWNRSHHPVIVQSYIHGRPANCAVVCWKGRVLAGIGVEVVSSDGLTGPASVVRVVDNSEMMFAAERIASRLGLSGFFGLDFVIEQGSGDTYLIEMNPRTTPLCHLRLGKGRDMAGALWAQLAGQSFPEAPPATQNEMIAYFPQAWDSELLKSCFQDVPQGEPELVQELLRPWPDRTLLFRLFNHKKRNSTSAKEGRDAEYSDHDELDAYDPRSCTCRETLATAANKISLAKARTRSGRHDLS